LISVVESIKLLVEDPAIARKIQVVMLVEEDILQDAIVKKYREAIPSLNASPNDGFVRWRVIQETNEKLFTSHFRLPPLSRRDLISLVERFSGFRDLQDLRKRSAAEADQELQELENIRIDEKIMVSPGRPGTPFQRGIPRADIPPEPATPPTPPEYRKKTNREIEDEQAELNQSIQEARQRSTRERLDLKDLARIDRGSAGNNPLSSTVPVAAGAFQLSELEAIIAVFDETTELRTHLGPRTVRTFLFRYQLARMLLQAAGVSWSPRGIAEHLAKRMLRPELKTVIEYVSTEEHGDPFAKIVDQVC